MLPYPYLPVPLGDSPLGVVTDAALRSPFQLPITAYTSTKRAICVHLLGLCVITHPTIQVPSSRRAFRQAPLGQLGLEQNHYTSIARGRYVPRGLRRRPMGPVDRHRGQRGPRGELWKHVGKTVEAHTLADLPP